MVRLVVALGIVAFALPARATELPHRVGLYAPGNAALPMTQSKVAVTVRGPIVEATVTQTFTNDRDRAIEATYIFPLPADAAVSAMSIDVGDEHIHAEIARRDEALRRYEQAVEAGKGAAQLDQERPDVFTQSISAIPPHGTVSVTLRFDSTAQYADGTWQLVLPLVIAPRYAPGTASGRPTTGTGRSPDTDRSPDASRVTPGGSPGAGGSTAIAIEFADAVEDVTSPTHELARDGARYTFADPKSDHDAIVRWRAKLPSAGWVEQDDDSGYAAVVVAAPPAAANAHAADLVLLVDRGATMHGDADAVERPLVRALLGACERASVSGGITTSGAAADVQKALDRAWSETHAWDLTKLLGGTHARGVPVVLVTDGLTTDDRAAIAAAQKVGAPIHVIGLGPAPNRSLLAAIAQATGGTVRFALPGDDLAAIARDVASDASTPIAPLSITWGTLAASDIVPAVLPRVGAGQSALVLARVKKAERANARARGDVFQLGMINTARPPAGATTPRGALARRWARLKLDELVASGSPEKITAHALNYGLVSPTTSMIAVGEQVVVQGGVKHTVAVPVSVPEGMRWQEVQRATRVVMDGKNAEEQRAHELDKKGKADRVAEKTEPKPKKAPPREDGESRKEKKHVDYDEEDNDRGDDAPARHAHGGHKGATQPAPVATTPVAPQTTPPPAADTGGAEAPAPPAHEPSMSKEEVATIEAEGGDEVVLTSEASPAIARRLALSLGAGLAIEHGHADFASALTARYEVGHRTLVGIEGGLWIVGSDVQGDVLATFARRHIARILELGAGAGVHLGGGVGPAFDLVLRTRLPVRHLALFLRYDGALLFHDNTKDGQNTTTIGVETTW